MAGSEPEGRPVVDLGLHSLRWQLNREELEEGWLSQKLKPEFREASSRTWDAPKNTFIKEYPTSCVFFY